MKQAGIKIAYINVRSLLPKIEQIQHLLYEKEIHLLGVGETWLDDTILNSDIAIDGYTIVRVDRNRHGGGVLFFVNDKVSHREVKFSPSEVENVWITINVHKEQYLIGNMYRPPSSDSNYFDKMLDLLEQASNEAENVILLGDLNYDYKTDMNPIFLIESMFEMKQLVMSPTRITNTSSMLIDIILSNVSDKHFNTEVLPIGMSDHFPVVTVLRSQDKAQAVHKTVQFRDYKNFVNNDFLNELFAKLENIQTTETTQENDPEKLWQTFKLRFLEVSNKHAPVKTMRLKNRYCPWMNKAVIDLMYKRDYIHRKAIRDQCPVMWDEYKTLRNKVTSLIKENKRKYFENELCKNSSNAKQFWKTVNKLTGKCVYESAPKELSANAFNEYFSNIGHNVVKENVQSSAIQEVKWKNPPCVHSFKFSSADDTDVRKYIKSLGSDSSNDVIGFDAKLLFISIDVITPIITKIINATFLHAKLPNDWKFSRVTPVYKGKGAKNDMNNYRPISVIGHVAKIVEKVVQKQLLWYLLSNDLIVNDQSAYRPMHNTQTALHRVVDSWIDNVNDSLLTGVCFLDIRKCFDTIDHDVLKEKLGFYGVKNSEYKWFCEYLNGRAQVVKHNNTLSNKSDITIGVPQGSVLGPILFTLFVNDITQYSETGICNLYADDTIAYCQGNTVQEVQEKLQLCVSKLSEWYSNNKLSVNTNKCEVMLIASRNRVISDHLDIRINGTDLLYVTCANYLGMQIDNNLSWNQYVDKLSSNIACKLNRLRRLKGVVSCDVLSKIFLTFIQPCIDYAISVWGQTSEYNIDKIQRLQNFAARMVTNNYDFINIRGIEIVKSLGWMNVRQRCFYFTTTLMFKCIHGLAPSYMVNDVVMNCDVNQMNTRSHPMNLYVPSVTSQFGKKSFKYAGAIAWNGLPSDLKDIYIYNSFKSKLKMFILHDLN